MGCSAKTGALVEWSVHKPTRQAVCNVVAHTADVKLPKPFGAQKIMSKSKTLATELLDGWDLFLL